MWGAGRATMPPPLDDPPPTAELLDTGAGVGEEAALWAWAWGGRREEVREERDDEREEREAGERAESWGRCGREDRAGFAPPEWGGGHR